MTWMCDMGICRSSVPAPLPATTIWLTSHDRGSTITRVTSPTSRSAVRTFDFSFGCSMLLLLDRLGRIHGRVFQRREKRHERGDVLVVHQLLILVRHLLLFIFLLEPIR